MAPKISIVIPVYNDASKLGRLLYSLKQQTFKDFEIIVIDDCSNDNTPDVAKKYASKFIRNKSNKGPAFSRNAGIKNSSGKIIAFTDSDCEAATDWIGSIIKLFSDKNISVMMGNVVIPNSTFLADCISALGFPAGGHVGFEKMWHVTKEGFTDHLSSCNMALRKDIFKKYGLLDESFQFAGAEDAELSYRLAKNNVKIKYNSSAVIIHEPRTSLKSFIKWQITRGRSNYQFKKKVGNIHSFIKLRLWSSKNIVKKYMFSIKIFFILPLLLLSFILQQYGCVKEYFIRK